MKRATILVCYLTPPPRRVEWINRLYRSQSYALDEAHLLSQVGRPAWLERVREPAALLRATQR